MTNDERLTRLEQELAAALVRVQQHEQALVYAREMLEDYQRRHEFAEQSWLRQFTILEQQNARLKEMLVQDTVRQARSGSHGYH